jgi:AcrR family transcriptional regulator
VARTPKPRPRTRLAASARRAQLVEVGRTVFAQRGYEATSVEEIAERAGITKPIVYEHFGGKEGLYAVIVDREIEHIVQRIVEAISSGSPRQRLERAALAFLTYVKERPGGFAVLLRDAPASKRTGEMPALMYDLADRVGAIFTDQFRRAGYDAKTAPIYAHALVGMVAFVGQWWTESPKPPPVQVVAGHMAALAWMGLRHLPRRPVLVDDEEAKSRKPKSNV